jgi:hypothetical protein
MSQQNSGIRSQVFESLVEDAFEDKDVLEDGNPAPAEVLRGLRDYADWIINQGNGGRRVQKTRELLNQMVGYIESGEEIRFTWHQAHKGEGDYSEARFTRLPEKSMITASADGRRAAIGLDYQDGDLVLVVFNSIQAEEYDALVRLTGGDVEVEITGDAGHGNANRGDANRGDAGHENANPSDLLKRITDEARAHGQRSHPDHEIGDLQESLREALRLMDGRQLTDLESKLQDLGFLE